MGTVAKDLGDQELVHVEFGMQLRRVEVRVDG
jgi:hypothetical protein